MITHNDTNLVIVQCDQGYQQLQTSINNGKER